VGLEQLQRRRQLRVQRRRQGVEREPAERVELVRLPDPCPCHPDGEDDRHPAIVADHGALAQPGDLQRLGRVLLGDLARDRLLEALAGLHGAGPAVPGAGLVAGAGGAAGQQDPAGTVVADEDTRLPFHADDPDRQGPHSIV